jgi:capsule biosynthesis phosphatase
MNNVKLRAGMRIVIDLDDTICRPIHSATNSQAKYAEATPIIPTIEWLKQAREAGAYIIILTARRMLTHKGDLNKIVEDVGQITHDWLKKWEVPYDELVFGKPYGDVYVDDKAINVEEIW